MNNRISMFAAIKFCLLSLFCMALAGCGDDSSNGLTNTLVYSRQGESGVLDPIEAETGETAKVLVNIFETLVTYDEKALDIVPCLATDWKMSDDGLTWTFTLRKNVQFHDGTPFNADAVIFSFGRLIHDDHPGSFTHVKPYINSFKVIDRIESDQPNEVVFHLKHKDSIFLQNLCMFAANIVSPTAVLKYKERFGDHPVGTGPFRFERWKKQKELELVAFENYWDGRVKLDRLIFVPDKEAQTRKKEILKGTYHIADNLPADVVDELAQNPNLTTQEYEGVNVGFITMQNEKPPLDNPLVRKAIWHAIDKKRLIADVFRGHALPAVTVVPPTLWGHHDGLKDREYDPEKSKALLKEAGITGPITLRLFVMDSARPYMQRPRETAIFVKNALAKIGIEVEIITNETNRHFEQIGRGEHDLALAGWSSDNFTPDNFLYELLDSDNANQSGNNNSRYRNAEVHKLLAEAKQEFDRAKQIALYKKAQEIIYNDAPLVPLVHTKVRIVQNKKVRGYFLHSSGMVRLKWTYFAGTEANSSENNVANKNTNEANAKEPSP